MPEHPRLITCDISVDIMVTLLVLLVTAMSKITMDPT